MDLEKFYALCDMGIAYLDLQEVLDVAIDFPCSDECSHTVYYENGVRVEKVWAHADSCPKIKALEKLGGNHAD
jgi:hypothetical protein